MQTCQTCGHWKFVEADWEFDRLQIGECKRVLMRETAISEESVGFERFSDEWEAKAPDVLRAAKAFVVDASSYHAALRTFPDFGCVLHEPKAAIEREMVAGDIYFSGGAVSPIHDIEWWKRRLNDGFDSKRTFAFRDAPDAPLQFVPTPGETIEPGDTVILDPATGWLRKATLEDQGQKFVVSPGCRVNDRGYLEMPR